MSNPALSNNPQFRTLTADELNRIYNSPSADPQRPGIDAGATQAAAVGAANATRRALPTEVNSANPLTYENTIFKTVLLFIVLLAGAAIGWMTSTTMPLLWIGGAVVGLVLGLINAFKREPNVALIVLYSAAQGLFLGGISSVFEAQYAGIVMQAILGTLAVFAVTLLLFRSGKVRTSPRMTKIVLIGMVGYLVFSVINVILMMTGLNTDPWGMRSGWLGVVIGLVAVFLAAYSLVMDFEMIQNGVKNRVPERYGWSAAFGLMVTLIWLYLEILRILAILRGD